MHSLYSVKRFCKKVACICGRRCIGGKVVVIVVCTLFLNYALFFLSLIMICNIGNPGYGNTVIPRILFPRNSNFKVVLSPQILRLHNAEVEDSCSLVTILLSNNSFPNRMLKSGALFENSNPLKFIVFHRDNILFLSIVSAIVDVTPAENIVILPK